MDLVVCVRYSSSSSIQLGQQRIEQWRFGTQNLTGVLLAAYGTAVYQPRIVGYCHTVATARKTVTQHLDIMLAI